MSMMMSQSKKPMITFYVIIALFLILSVQAAIAGENLPPFPAESQAAAGADLRRPGEARRRVRHRQALSRHSGGESDRRRAGAPVGGGAAYAVCGGVLVALGEIEGGELRPTRVFNLPLRR